MSELGFETSYEDEVTVEIMDWALDTMPDEVKSMSLQDIADKYWEVHLDHTPDEDSFSVLPDFDELYGGDDANPSQGFGDN